VAILHLRSKTIQAEIVFTDITMEAAEFGVTDMPEDHPEFNLFKTERLLPADRQFDLVFCDGQVLRNHAKFRHVDREPYEATRLNSAQLLIAMAHMKPGGTLVMLLHKVESWNSLKLLQAFGQFSRIQLFKPTTSHVSRSSFYLIAQDIKPDHENALVAREGWLQDWKDAIFHRKREVLPTDEELMDLLREFGGRTIELAEPMWKRQKEGIKSSRWFKKQGEEAGAGRVRNKSAAASRTWRRGVGEEGGVEKKQGFAREEVFEKKKGVSTEEDIDKEGAIGKEGSIKKERGIEKEEGVEKEEVANKEEVAKC
jgi:23S rRNA U2552 (ribose-2'-O)-methylase RlmE/FtsJ